MSELSDIEQLQTELTDAITKAEENLAGWKRTQADFENYQKRRESENTELISFGKQVAFVKILPILDSLEMAILHAPEIQDEKFVTWKNGMEGIIKQINGALSEIGIEKIQAVGTKFDPNFHEAVKELPPEDGKEPGTIAEQYQTGFTINGKVLRPAQVGVYK